MSKKSVSASLLIIVHCVTSDRSIRVSSISHRSFAVLMLSSEASASLKPKYSGGSLAKEQRQGAKIMYFYLMTCRVIIIIITQQLIKTS